LKPALLLCLEQNIRIPVPLVDLPGYVWATKLSSLPAGLFFGLGRLPLYQYSDAKTAMPVQQQCEHHSQEETDKLTFRAPPLQASHPKLADDVGPIFLGGQPATHLRKLLIGEGHLPSATLAQDFNEAWLGTSSDCTGKGYAVTSTVALFRRQTRFVKDKPRTGGFGAPPLLGDLWREREFSPPFVA